MDSEGVGEIELKIKARWKETIDIQRKKVHLVIVVFLDQVKSSKRF